MPRSKLSIRRFVVRDPAGLVIARTESLVSAKMETQRHGATIVTEQPSDVAYQCHQGRWLPVKKRVYP